MPAFLSDAEIANFRRRLTAEAERQFLRNGIETVSMRSLAKELDCSATTPYRYFKNKNEILAAVRAAILDRVSSKLEATRRDDAREWARAHMKAFVDFAFQEPGSYRLVFDLYQSDEDDYPDLVRANERALKVNYGYVTALVEQGHLLGDPEQLGYLFFAQLHGLIVLRMTSRPPSTRGEFDQKCRETFKLISRGLHPPSRPASPGLALEPAAPAGEGRAASTRRRGRVAPTRRA